MSSTGVIYIATGEKYVNEACQSVQSLTQSNPGITTCLFTDAIPAEKRGLFNEVRIIESPARGNLDKVHCMPLSPFERTVFLDSDTLVVDDISDLFESLEHFDFGAAIEVARGFWYYGHSDEKDIPPSFPEINSGVMAYRKGEPTQQLFSDWERFYESSKSWQSRIGDGRIWDQPGLRRALFENKQLRLFTLPPEYNALKHFGTFLWGPARILHGRGLDKYKEDVNFITKECRVYCQNIGTLSRFHLMPLGKLLKTVLKFNYCFANELLHRLIGRHSPY